jgi:hypothetical protein
VLLLATAICCVTARSRAEQPVPRVIVFGTEAGPAPSGFVEALSIQLSGTAGIDIGAALSGALPEKVAAVQPLLARGGAPVGIWLERSAGQDGATEFLVYVASRREDRVLVQVVRLPGPDSAETDRALALKVREVLDAVLAAGPERALTAPPVARSVPRAPEAAATPGAITELALVGSSAGNGSGEEQLGGVAGAGVRLRGASWQLELAGRAAALGGTEVRARERHVETRELILAPTLRALIASRWAAAGAHASGGVRIVSASGRAPDGQTGDATKLLPIVMIGPEARAVLGQAVALRAAMGIELTLRRQRFAVRGDPLLDAGSLRGVAEVGLVLAFE